MLREPVRSQERGRKATERRLPTWTTTVVLVALLTFVITAGSMLLTGPQGMAFLSNEMASQPAGQGQADTPDNPQLLFNQFEPQIILAQQEVERQPDNPEVWIELGNLLYDSVQIVRELQPDSDIYQQRLTRWIEASAAYSEALRLEPQNATVRADMAISLCYYGAGENEPSYVDMGLQQAQQAIDTDPHNERVLLGLGLCLVQTQPPQTEAALQYWRTVLSLPSADPGIAAEAQRLVEVYSQ